MKHTNIYQILMNNNKEIIDLLMSSLDIYNIEDLNLIKKRNIKEIKKFNKDIKHYWKVVNDNKKETGTFDFIFKPVPLINNTNPFALSSRESKLIVGLKVNDFHIEINNLENEDKKIIPYITFRFKNIGIDSDKLYYNVNISKHRDKVKNIQIIVNNESRLANLDGFKYYLPNLISSLMPSMGYKTTEFNLIDLKIQLDSHKVDFFKVLLGDLEYKKELDSIFDYEALTMDSKKLKEFIEHENLFGVLDINNLILEKSIR